MTTSELQLLPTKQTTLPRKFTQQIGNVHNLKPILTLLQQAYIKKVSMCVSVCVGGRLLCSNLTWRTTYTLGRLHDIFCLGTPTPGSGEDQRVVLKAYAAQTVYLCEHFKNPN